MMPGTMMMPNAGSMMMPMTMQQPMYMGQAAPQQCEFHTSQLAITRPSSTWLNRDDNPDELFGICNVSPDLRLPVRNTNFRMFCRADGAVHPDFPQLGPAQPYPKTVTASDEQLLARLHQMGHTAGADGMPGYPYIGAPYIGMYNANQEAAAEEPAPYQAEDDEVRGTQV